MDCCCILHTARLVFGSVLYELVQKYAELLETRRRQDDGAAIVTSNLKQKRNHEGFLSIWPLILSLVHDHVSVAHALSQQRMRRLET